MCIHRKFSHVNKQKFLKQGAVNEKEKMVSHKFSFSVGS